MTFTQHSNRRLVRSRHRIMRGHSLLEFRGRRRRLALAAGGQLLASGLHRRLQGFL